MIWYQIAGDQGFFFIICDKYTNISNKEQLTICINFDEDFFSFYNVPDTASETIVSVIKDVLFKDYCYYYLIVKIIS